MYEQSGVSMASETGELVKQVVDRISPPRTKIRTSVRDRGSYLAVYFTVAGKYVGHMDVEYQMQDQAEQICRELNDAGLACEFEPSASTNAGRSLRLVIRPKGARAGAMREGSSSLAAHA
jgi:hypothetical protein